MQPQDDPGWKVDWRIFVPGFQRAAMREPGPPLAKARSVFISSVFSLVLFGVVLAFLSLDEVEDGLDPAVGAAIVAGVGVVTLVLGRLPAVGRLAGSTPTALAMSWRKRQSLRIAIAQVAVLVGFVFAFLVGSIAMYLLGVAFAGVGYALAAPTSRSIERDQELLRQQGSPHDLRAALLAQP